MRIVDYNTFIDLPEGTMFCAYEDCIFGSLYIKEETISDKSDWFQICLQGNLDQNQGEDFSEVCDVMKNKSVLLDFDITERDGLFDYDRQFAIYDDEDILNMVNKLNEIRKMNKEKETQPVEENQVENSTGHSKSDKKHEPEVWDVADLSVRCSQCSTVTKIETVERGWQFLMPTASESILELFCPVCENKMSLFYENGKTVEKKEVLLEVKNDKGDILFKVEDKPELVAEIIDEKIDDLSEHVDKSPEDLDAESIAKDHDDYLVSQGKESLTEKLKENNGSQEESIK